MPGVKAVHPTPTAAAPNPLTFVERMERLRVALGLKRNINVMLIALVILGLGEELWMRFMPKYLEVLGASALAIGAFGTLKDLLDALYPYPGGWMTDRLGRKIALIVFAFIALLGYLMYWWAPSWEWILVGTIFVAAWSSFTVPAVFAIIGDHLPASNRAMGFGVQSILKRIPIVLAPLAGGYFIARFGVTAGVHWGLAITVVLTLATMLFIQRYYRETVTPAPRDPHNFRSVWRGLDPALKKLLFADALVRWAEDMPRVFVILYVINALHFSAADFGLLTALQMAVSIAVYIPIARLSDRMNRKPFVLLTFAFFALFPLILTQVHSFVGLALAFAVAGLREIGEPARKALIVDLADPASIGRAVGMYYLIRGFAVFPAALLGGWLWGIDPQLPFYVAFVMGVIGWLVYWRFGPGTAPIHTRT